ncbi:MAG: molybdenum cofactor guanylyltransferase [Myxococcota bacterium]|nr:molybdenum cofactor guanylyltransferase [Myxococcota bacterium]
MKPSEVTLAILAGGKASRLGGVPKGLLRVDGESLLDRQLRMGAECGLPEVLLVANEPGPYRDFLAAAPSVRVVADAIPDRGAPGGVHAALVHGRTRWVLVLAADMPFLSAPVLRTLLAEAGNSPLACFESGGRLQPFPGVYAAELAETWARLLDGQPSLNVLFRSMGGAVLPEEKLRRVDPDLLALVNVNRPEDRVRWKIDWPIGWKDAWVTADD